MRLIYLFDCSRCLQVCVSFGRRFDYSAQSPIMTGQFYAVASQPPATCAKVVVVAVDSHIETSHPVVHFALRHVVRKGDALHLVTILPLGGDDGDVDLIESPGRVWSDISARKKEREANEAAAVDSLKTAAEICNLYPQVSEGRTPIMFFSAF